MGQSLKIIGNRIRQYRKLKKLSQEQLAEMVGTHHSYIGKIERGEHNVTVQTLEKIADALEVNLAAMFSDIEFKGIELTDEILEVAALMLEQSETNQRKTIEILKIMYRNEN